MASSYCTPLPMLVATPAIRVIRLAMKVFSTRKNTVLRPICFRRTELPRLVMLEMMLKISSGMTTAETTWA